ncbi:calcium incorporation protein MxaA [Leptothrix sp. BB-4]
MTWARPVRIAVATALLGLAAFAVPAAEDPPVPAAVVRQPRAFGHVLGDVLTQRILLDDAAVPVAPPADRVGLWLERRAPRLEVDAEGRRWLALDHQVINAPRTLTETRLPALTLVIAPGRRVAVPAWPIRIGPITPADTPVDTPADTRGSGAADELAALRPDRLAALPAAAPLRRQLMGSAALLGAVLLAWAGWWAWREARDARQLPFAQAWRQIRRLRRSNPSRDDAPEAWRALHHALNASAGRAVQGSTLDRLLDAAPHLQPLRQPLTDFFRASDDRFFAAVDDPAAADHVPDSRPPYPLLSLARALRDAERRQQG